MTGKLTEHNHFEIENPWDEVRSTLDVVSIIGGLFVLRGGSYESCSHLSQVLYFLPVLKTSDFLST